MKKTVTRRNGCLRKMRSPKPGKKGLFGVFYLIRSRQCSISRKKKGKVKMQRSHQLPTLLEVDSPLRPHNITHSITFSRSCDRTGQDLTLRSKPSTRSKLHHVRLQPFSTDCPRMQWTKIGRATYDEHATHNDDQT